jgi:hypothetical protein
MLKGLDMVVYQALKRILGDAGVATVLDDYKYVDQQLRSKEWERQYQEREKAKNPHSTEPIEPFYTFDKSDLENTVCIAATPLATISYGCYDWDCGLLDPSTIELPNVYYGYNRVTSPYSREKVNWLNHRPDAYTSKELAVVFATVSLLS